MNYPDELDGTYVPFESITWNPQRAPRSWAHGEFDKAYQAMPEKMEACGGMLFCDDDDRLKVFGALLENIGIGRAVRFGDPALWRAAIAALPD